MILGLYPDLAKGALLDAAGAQHAGPLALVELENGGDAPTYVAGTENFYAIKDGTYVVTNAVRKMGPLMKWAST